MDILCRRALPALFLLVFLALLPLHSQPSLVPDPRLPAFGDPSVPLTGDAFAQLSLIVSGTPETQTENLLARLRALEAELKAGLPPDADERVKGEAVLETLYRKTLTRYSEFQTRIDVALTTGAYNCVSSAVLYYYLAKTVGLDVEGVETPVHSFCTVLVGDSRIDVETTNPYGFDPGAKKELPATIAAQKKYVLVPSTKYRLRAAIGERRLLALVYNNRIADLEKKGDYIASVGLGLDSWTLQGDAASLRELSERFINYAISLSNRGKHTDGLDFVIAARDRWGDYSGYKDFISAAAGNALNALMVKNDFEGGFLFLGKYGPVIESAQYAQMSGLLNVNYVGDTVQKSGMADSLAAIERSRGALPKGEYEKLTVFVYSREADRVSRGGFYLEAAAVLEAGLKVLPGQSDLARQRTLYRQNYAIEVHNSAAKAYNAGDKETVKKMLLEGLALVPESTMLQNDLKNLK